MRYSASELAKMIVPQLPDKCSIVECGVFVGTSTINVAKVLQEHKKNFNITAVDNFEFSNVNKAELPQHLGDEYPKDLSYFELYWWNVGRHDLHDFCSVVEEDSVVASNYFMDDSIDWLFLDDGHTYQHVRDEIKAWLPKVKKGGWITGDDYNSQDVKRAVKEVLPNAMELKRNGYHNWYYEVR